jgi:hypothetical protein
MPVSPKLSAFLLTHNSSTTTSVASCDDSGSCSQNHMNLSAFCPNMYLSNTIFNYQLSSITYQNRCIDSLYIPKVLECAVWRLIHTISCKATEKSMQMCEIWWKNHSLAFLLTSCANINLTAGAFQVVTRFSAYTKIGALLAKIYVIVAWYELIPRLNNGFDWVQGL